MASNSNMFLIDLIVDRILSYLRRDELQAARLVCKLWRKLSIPYVKFDLGMDDRPIYTKEGWGDAVHLKLRYLQMYFSIPDTNTLSITEDRMAETVTRDKEEAMDNWWGDLPLVDFPREETLLWMRKHGGGIRSLELNHFVWWFGHVKRGTMLEDSIFLSKLLQGFENLVEVGLTEGLIGLSKVRKGNLDLLNLKLPEVPSVRRLRLGIDWRLCPLTDPFTLGGGENLDGEFVKRILLGLFPNVVKWIFEFKSDVWVSALYIPLLKELEEANERRKMVENGQFGHRKGGSGRSGRISLDFNFPHHGGNMNRDRTPMEYCSPGILSLVRSLSLVMNWNKLYMERDNEENWLVGWRRTMGYAAPFLKNLRHLSLVVRQCPVSFPYLKGAPLGTTAFSLPPMPHLSRIELHFQAGRLLRDMEVPDCEDQWETCCPVPNRNWLPGTWDMGQPAVPYPFEIKEGQQLRLLTTEELNYVEHFPSLRRLEFCWPGACFSPSLFDQIMDNFLPENPKMAASTLDFFILPNVSDGFAATEAYSQFMRRFKTNFPNATLMHK